ncbi:MAG: serine--tRNA ligase [Chloroflexi bacterium]|nr:serine--tRNA ligase [Chloroflexota bacterium]
MLSIELIRKDPAAVRRALARRHDDSSIEPILQIDERRRALLTEAEGLRARRNEVSKQIGKMNPKPPDLIAEMRQVGDTIKELETQVTALEQEQRDALLRLPNIPRDGVPDGPDASANKEVRQWGARRDFAFKPQPHWEIAAKLGIIDFARGQKISGSRFYILQGRGAKLQRSLIQWMLDRHVSRGYTEVYPPYMVREQVVYGSGQLPKFRDNLYRDAEEDYWMVPTAEVPITGMYADEILPPGTAPIRHAAYTACFRREKMSAGKDIRGIKRGHQFDKVEMYKLVPPETSGEELKALVADATSLAEELELPYRLLQLCTGDLGFAAAESYDIELWAPGCNEWLEVSSCSNCGDFQARRANVRFRREANAKPEFVHTLNGSGLALPRVMIAILETYQEGDGSVTVPKALRPYTGFDTIPVSPR